MSTAGGPKPGPAKTLYGNGAKAETGIWLAALRSYVVVSVLDALALAPYPKPKKMTANSLIVSPFAFCPTEYWRVIPLRPLPALSEKVLKDPPNRYSSSHWL